MARYTRSVFVSDVSALVTLGIADTANYRYSHTNLPSLETS